VVAYNRPYYHVIYEDGDEEDMSEDEMRSILDMSPLMGQSRTVAVSKRRRSSASIGAVARTKIGHKGIEEDSSDEEDGVAPWRVSGAIDYDCGEGMSFFGPAVVELQCHTKKSQPGRSFADEMFGRRIQIGQPKSKSSKKAPPSKILDRGVNYELFAFKRNEDSKQYRGHSYKGCILSYYYIGVSGHGYEPINLQKNLEGIADFASLEDPRKTQARLELFHSNSIANSKPCRLSVDNIELIGENVSEVNGEPMGDGCGFIGSNILERLLGASDAARCLGIQVRLFGPQIGIFKGMLCKKADIDCIQLPPSMRKVPPSKVATKEDNWVFIVVIRFSPSKTTREYHKILHGGKASPSFETKALSSMMRRVWEALGAPRSVIATHIREKYPKHCYVVGLADPTNLIPPDHIFVTGLSNCPSKVFVTRAPCVKAQDGRILKVMTDRPRAMTHATWEWLQELSFGAILFSTAGSGVPIPMLCAEGDLDGDLYFMCWDENIITTLRQRSAPPFPPAKPKAKGNAKTNPNWLADVQRHMTDVSVLQEHAFIAKLYKAMEKIQKSSPRGMDDPDAIAYANAYVMALNRGKHGVDISLPQHLRAAVGLK
jgi:TusA-related sulfurtransferase